MEVSSFNCRSETDSMFSLEEHLNTLAEKLCGLKFNKRAENKLLLYQDIANFVRNFARFQFDPDLLIKKKIGQYLSILYNLLLEINDYECEAYSLLLPSLSSLITKVKKQLLHSVSITLTQYKSGTRLTTNSVFSNDNDSMKLSVAPSLDEKINYLIQNHSLQRKEDTSETVTMITIEDAAPQSSTLLTSSETSDLCPFEPQPAGPTAGARRGGRAPAAEREARGEPGEHTDRYAEANAAEDIQYLQGHVQPAHRRLEGHQPAARGEGQHTLSEHGQRGDLHRLLQATLQEAQGTESVIRTMRSTSRLSSSSATSHSINSAGTSNR